MTLRTRFVIIHYNPSTNQQVGVFLPEREMTAEELEETCLNLNPVNGVRCRVGVLTVNEEKQS